MPNWTRNIFKIIVPARSRRLIPAVMAALAEDGADTSDTQVEGVVWIDFHRLLPVPKCLVDTPDNATVAIALATGRWPKHLEVQNNAEIPADEEGRIALAEQLLPGTRAMVERVRTNMAETGVPIQIEWQEGKWGTKWTPASDDIRHPNVFDANDMHGYEQFEDCTIISYDISTAWTEPSGYAHELVAYCQEHGFGLRWWYSHDDGGQSLNPLTDEVETVWTPYEDVSVDPEEISLSDLSAQLACGPRTTPRAEALLPLTGRNPLYSLWS